MYRYRNTVFYDFKSRFIAIFSSTCRHRLVLKIPFPDHIFPKILKYRTGNLHFPSTGKYYAPPSNGCLKSLFHTCEARVAASQGSMRCLKLCREVTNKAKDEA